MAENVNVPFALIWQRAQGVRLAAINEAARHYGLEIGMPLNDARAIFPALALAQADPAADEAFLQRLALWFERYSPRVAIDRSHMPAYGPDGLLIDIAGCEHLFGGEAAMLTDMRDRLTRFGLTARLTAAPTVGAAWALSHSEQNINKSALTPFNSQHRETTCCSSPPSQIDLQTLLAPLSVRALRLSETVLSDLNRFGLRNIGDLLALPRASLVRRFDGKRARKTAAPRGKTDADAVILRLDQLLGKRAEPVAPEAPSPQHIVRQAFAEPLVKEASFAAVLDQLLAILMPKLEQDGLGARRLRLIFEKVDGGRQILEVASATANRNCPHFKRLYRDRLGSFDPAFGVDEIRLVAQEVERLSSQQMSWDQAATDLLAGPSLPVPNTELSELVDHLANRFGAHRLTRAEAIESHLPEHAERFIPIMPSGKASNMASGGEVLRHLTQKSANVASYNQPYRPSATRPIRLLETPEEIDVVAEIPEGPPRQFKWRRIAHHIRRAEGPERIASEWWHQGVTGEPPPRPRDYFRIENDVGQRFWVYRDGLYRDLEHIGGPEWFMPRWFIHGLFA